MLLTRRIAAMLLLCLGSGPAWSQACAPKVPASDLVEAGTLQLAINPTLPPQQFVDEKGELQGLNVELARELGKHMCLTTAFVRMDFPAMVPALRAGRFDGIDTGMFWTEERSKLMYMVPYAQQAIGVFGMASSNLKLASFDDLAGHTAGIEIGTYQERKTKEANEDMVKRGLKPVTLLTFTTATDATAALRARQVDVVIIVEDAAQVHQQAARHAVAADRLWRDRHHLRLPRQGSGRGGCRGLHRDPRGGHVRRAVRQVRHGQAAGPVRDPRSGTAVTPPG